MDITSRKLSLVQEFLRISDEDLISKLEKVMRSERKKRMDKPLSSFSVEELQSMVNQAEKEIDNGMATEATELLKKIQEWK